MLYQDYVKSVCNIGGIPREIKLRLCNLLEFGEIITLCGMVPSWKLILQGRFVEKVLFNRERPCIWIDREVGFCVHKLPPRTDLQEEAHSNDGSL